jgi:hypothetical protein
MKGNYDLPTESGVADLVPDNRTNPLGQLDAGKILSLELPPLLTEPNLANSVKSGNVMLPAPPLTSFDK